jgi:hypothetical protein
MPGMFYYGPRGQATQAPEEAPFALASSKTSYTGDILVRAVISNNTVVRPLTGADITALYQDGSGNTCGILGLNPSDWVSDSNGIASSAPAPPGVLANVPARLIIPTMAFGNKADAVTGRSRIDVPLVNGGTKVGGTLWQNTTVTQNLIGTAVGLKVSVISGVTYYFFDTAATTLIGTIVDVAVDDPMFNKTATANVLNTTNNPRCAIAVQFLGAYQQQGLLYNYLS